MTETFIMVRDQFSALHAWEDCPHPEVSFLRNPHRHIFHVIVKIKVTHHDRDVEFFMVKKALTEVLRDLFADRYLGSKSCEMMCEGIAHYLKLNYRPELNISSIQVWEDMENGAEVVF